MTEAINKRSFFQEMPPVPIITAFLVMGWFGMDLYNGQPASEEQMKEMSSKEFSIAKELANKKATYHNAVAVISREDAKKAISLAAAEEAATKKASEQRKIFEGQIKAREETEGK